jgi:predicted ATPase
MYLKQLKITNYKSFFETTEFNFEPGFNVLLGANSSGKSTVLESVQFHESKTTSHRSPLNMVDPETILADWPQFELTFASKVDDFCKMLSPGTDLYVGIGNEPGHFHCTDLGVINHRLKTDLLAITLEIGHAISTRMDVHFPNWPAVWRSNNAGVVTNFSALQVDRASATGKEVRQLNSGQEDINQIFTRTYPRIYKFSAERKIEVRCGHTSAELVPNCSNLAFCISQLQNNDHVLADTLMGLLRRVFPTIHRVRAPTDGSGLYELKVQTTNRTDLTVPINQVGTGVGNALAMLYVALTAPAQRFILLEEPNSFLHPRALRELLAILAEIGGKHQFFITTHSSDVLRTIKASTVTLLEYDGQQTTIKQTTGDKLHELQSGLVDLGISLTDLHGCDNVLWVEGETEAAVFPLLLRHFFPSLAQGIAVLPLHATGDFESRKFSPKAVAEIYRKLSQDNFLAPPMVAVTLDREKKSQSEIDHIEKDCAGVVHFLPKAMLEDYFLDADAIAFVLNKADITSAIVARILADEESLEACLLQPLNKTRSTLHAAKVLRFVFDTLAGVEYHKTSHGPKIAEWLIANKPEAFAELTGWFGKFLNGQK